MQRVVTELEEALRSSLAQLIPEPPYIDQSRLKPGYRFNEALAGAICRSFCMIVIYSPIYGFHKYCLRELRAMQILQAKRMSMLGSTFERDRGLIIPLILRGKENLPEYIRDIHYCDFSKFDLASRRISSDRGYLNQIEEIATFIEKLRNCFVTATSNPCADCESFQLPPESEVEAWQPPGRTVLPF